MCSRSLTRTGGATSARPGPSRAPGSSRRGGPATPSVKGAPSLAEPFEGGRSIAEGAGARARRRLLHLSRHPLWWAEYVWIRELRHREVTFRQNPRFRDWRPMYRVARASLARLAQRPVGELDAYFEELAPLQAD